VRRQVYQSSSGGKQEVPLETSVGMISNSTPRFAKMVSWKYSHLPSNQVEEDLRENHRCGASDTHIQEVSYTVGSQLLAQSAEVSYVHGITISEVASVSIGRDGAMMPLISENYREAMVGTLSLVNKDREVLHTIYLGASPQYGKATFDATLQAEILDLKRDFGHLPWSGVADGAANNWTFLATHVDEQIIDWWHAWQYIQPALQVIYPDKATAQKQVDKWKDKLQNKENSISDLLKLVKKHHKKLNKAKTPNATLQTTVTYLTNHHHQMNYAAYLKKNFLIGSGVTESACKTLIKSRFCGCGMQWKNENVHPMTHMRGLVLTPKRWEQAWKKLTKIDT
jgi:hypothetical protein